MAKVDVPIQVTTPIEIYIAGQATVVGPDDRLVIAFDEPFTEEDAARGLGQLDDLGLRGRVLLVKSAELAVIKSTPAPDPFSDSTPLVCSTDPGEPCEACQ